MIYRVVFTNLGILLVLLLIAELIFGNWLWGPNYGAMNIPRNVERYFDTSGLYKSGGGPATAGMLSGFGGHTTTQDVSTS